jgi:hypothetical protein
MTERAQGPGRKVFQRAKASAREKFSRRRPSEAQPAALARAGQPAYHRKARRQSNKGRGPPGPPHVAAVPTQVPDPRSARLAAAPAAGAGHSRTAATAVASNRAIPAAKVAAHPRISADRRRAQPRGKSRADASETAVTVG